MVVDIPVVIDVIIATVVDVAEQLKLTLNFAAGKSELVLDLMGKGAPHLRHQLMVVEQGHLPVILFQYQQVPVK